jgi:hypothetical protein
MLHMLAFYGQRKVLRERFDAHCRIQSTKQAILKKVFDKLPRGRPIVFAHGDAVFKSRGNVQAPTKTLRRLVAKAAVRSGGYLVQVPEFR